MLHIYYLAGDISLREKDGCAQSRSTGVICKDFAEFNKQEFWHLAIL